MRFFIRTMRSPWSGSHRNSVLAWRFHKDYCLSLNGVTTIIIDVLMTILGGVIRNGHEGHLRREVDLTASQMGTEIIYSVFLSR